MTFAPLPAAPSLEQLRKRARDLQRAHRAGDPRARARVGTQVDNAAEPLKLSTAQLVVAREHGFPSWPRLRAYVERVSTHGPDLQHAYHDDLDYYAERADGLLASAEDGTPGAVAAFERHGAPVDGAGAREVVARMHGFPSWPALRRHVAALRGGGGGEPFARAYRAIEACDATALAAELGRFPGLVTANGTNGNDLLGMATATGDERTVRLLLERGADPAHRNAHGWTALHQTAYANQARLARILLDAGAPAGVEARGEGGTPLVAALFWGHRATAELLAERGGIQPRNLRTAAGLGRLDILDELVPADGSVTPEATRRRGFYRPHSGFPAWRPSDDPQEALDEALAWAARNDRLEALDLLVRRGARVEADVYRGTALAWAAATGRPRAVERLIALGADPSGPSTFGGPSHGEGITPLHLAAQNGDLPVLDALLAGGADPTVTDALYRGTPAHWAANFGHTAARERLATAARPDART